MTKYGEQHGRNATIADAIRAAQSVRVSENEDVNKDKDIQGDVGPLA